MEKVSIVIPVYRNADSLLELYRRLQRAMEGLFRSYEIIFVNDACPEGSAEVLEELGKKDSCVHVVSLEKNMGQHQAILAGLHRVTGNSIVIMDADLQDPPEAIPTLLEKLQEGFCAVFAGRRGRYESFFRLGTSKVFKRLLHYLSGVPADAGLFVAMDRKMLEGILQFRTSKPFVVAMIGLTGLPQVSVPVKRVPRSIGGSAYNFWSRLRSGCRGVALVISHKLSR